MGFRLDPNIETEQDRKNEIEVLTKFCKRYKVSFKQTEKLCRYDAEIYKDDKLVGIAEIKCRNNSHNRFNTYFISYHKWAYGKEYSIQNKVKFLILIRFTDGIYFLDETFGKVEKGKYITEQETKTRGRFSVDKVIHFPINLLIKL